MKPERTATLKTFAGFFLYVLGISSFISFDLQQRRAILNIFLGLVFYKMIVEHFDRRYLKVVSLAILAVIAGNILFSIGQIFNVDPLFRHTSDTVVGFPRPVGLMRLEAHLGTLAAITGPLLMMIHPVLIVTVLPLLFWGSASAAVLAFVVSMGFLLYHQLNKKVFFVLFALLAAAGLFYIVNYDMPGGTFDYRLKIWFKSLQAVLPRSPFYGLGIGSFARWSPQSAQATNDSPLVWIWAHNEYIQLLFELGIVGVFFFWRWFKERFQDLRRCVKDVQFRYAFASFLGLSIVSFFHFPFHLGRLAGISLFSIALVHALALDNERTVCES